MGGGDLNAKKAWHPNTLKNQERVWKAEQAAAEEKKRIAELERERLIERDRAELNKLAKSNLANSNLTGDERLHWMYEKPDKKIQQEEYLLGKAIDKNHEQAGKSQADEIPAVSRRVVGSSMLSTSGDTQVDLARKMREDPLLLVKERERAARAALLNNPVQRARLTELLRKEQQNKKDKSKKKRKRSKDLDNILAEKLQALGGKQGVDLASLLATDDSSSESSDQNSKKKKKKKKKNKKKSKSKNITSGDSDDEQRGDVDKYPKNETNKINSSHITHKNKKKNTTEIDSASNKRKKRHHSIEDKSTKLHGKRRHRSYSSDDNEASDNISRNDGLNNAKRGYVREDRYCNDKQYSSQQISAQHSKKEMNLEDYRRRKNEREDQQRIVGTRGHNINDNDHRQTGRKAFNWERGRQSTQRSGLSEEEKAAKLAEMVAAGAEREKQRERRVAGQLVEKEKEDRPNSHSRSRNVIRQLPDSLESRLHSNRHYIQRDQRHMNEHFARR